MKIQVKKKTNPTIPSYGKYAAKAVHERTITADMIQKEIEQNCSARQSDVLLVLTELHEVLINHLQDGDRVELPAIGTLKLEVKSHVVDNPEDFQPEKHIKGFSLHILPKCKNGSPKLYKDVPLKRI